MSDTSLLNGKKVLAVDDEPDITEVLEELLDMCEVTTATTFDQAKLLLETQEFNLTILDIMGVDGYGLLEIANKRDIPAIMLTAHAFNSENLVRTIKEGAYAYIPKEEISEIASYMVDALIAREKGENPWSAWQDRLPTSYFEKRWGATWKDKERDFWDQFKASLKSTKSNK